jgi:hypothetical protein
VDEVEDSYDEDDDRSDEEGNTHSNKKHQIDSDEEEDRSDRYKVLRREVLNGNQLSVNHNI